MYWDDRDSDKSNPSNSLTMDRGFEVIIVVSVPTVFEKAETVRIDETFVWIGLSINEWTQQYNCFSLILFR